MKHQTKAWYTSQRRLASRWKMAVMDDRGMLHYERGMFCFEGKKTLIEVTRVHDVRLVPAASAWVMYAIALPLGYAVPLFALRPFDPVLLAFMTAAMVPGLVMGAWINRKQRFVRVEGEDGQGHAVVAHFYASRGLGWAGLLGANEDLAEAIRP